jgi:hypothetical protein
MNIAFTGIDILVVKPQYAKLLVYIKQIVIGLTNVPGHKGRVETTQNQKNRGITLIVNRFNSKFLINEHK